MILRRLWHGLTLDIEPKAGYFSGMTKSPVRYLDNLPSAQDFADEFGGEMVVIYDKNILQHPFLRRWISGFPAKIAVNAGESLKSLESYGTVAQRFQKIALEHNFSSRGLTFVAVGGGSVSDFVGFLASTYHRGKKLIAIPTTWLAAVDSAHGGKNGLNLNGVKNQIGTFYPAHAILIVKRVLETLPIAQFNDAYAEILKTGLVDSASLFNRIEKKRLSAWKLLPEIIKAKYRIVHRDPFEQSGARRVLNLGHTLGHVFESYHKISHGQAVGFGLLFALRYSYHEGFLAWPQFVLLSEKIFAIDFVLPYQEIIQIPRSAFKKILAQDKKMVAAGTVDFIFIQRAGKIVRKTVGLADLFNEIKRQQREL